MYSETDMSIPSPVNVVAHQLGPRDRRILVTGGGGFIGSHLVDALVEHNEVLVLDDFSTGYREQVADEATVIAGDVRDRSLLEEAMTGVDLVYHEAAVVSVPESVADPLGSNAVNAEASLQLLELAREQSARVVVASSAAIYGDPERTPISEDDRLSPRTPYGVQKLTLDHYTRLYHELYDLETVVLRYFNAYGPRADAGEYADVVSVFERQATAGDPITIEGSWAQTRDFVHVEDIVQANLRAATTDAVGNAYNIGSGEATSIADLAELIRELAGSDSPITHTEARPGDIGSSLADISAARADLGYAPTVTLEEGLASTVSK
jgi:UDP-glucose 4-epimerase